MTVKNIFVTGSAGYIGSHTCVTLLGKGYDVTVIDNFSNSNPEAVFRVREVTGKPFSKCQSKNDPLGLECKLPVSRGSSASNVNGSGIPNNLMPYISQVAVGRLSELKVFGSDYPTPDGTGMRDYIHVMDLAEGHAAAVERLRSAKGVITVNLGAGRGYSVLEMIAAFERACKKKWESVKIVLILLRWGGMFTHNQYSRFKCNSIVIRGLTCLM